jgi:hypothetical protein
VRPEDVESSEDVPVEAAGVGDADGSGLAAETTATPPATSSAAAMPAVRTVRRKPVGRWVDLAADAASVGWSIAGVAGWSVESIWISCYRSRWWDAGPDARGAA